MNKGEIMIYKTKDGETFIDVKMEEETVWLTQAQMVDLFHTTKQNVSLHINNVYKENATQIQLQNLSKIFNFQNN